MASGLAGGSAAAGALASAGLVGAGAAAVASPGFGLTVSAAVGVVSRAFGWAGASAAGIVGAVAASTLIGGLIGAAACSGPAASVGAFGLVAAVWALAVAPCRAVSAASAVASGAFCPSGAAAAAVGGGGVAAWPLWPLPSALGSEDFGALTCLGRIPVARTETRILPSRSSSKAEPTMMLALVWAAARTLSTASSSSKRVRSRPPVTLISTPRAPSTELSSSRGLAIAASAASMARRGPSASPAPMIALPVWVMTLRKSAKSRLISPGLTIRSVTPRTPAQSTLSALWKASATEVFSVAILKRFWFGMTIRVSTWCSRSSIPSSATSMRSSPSKRKGLVTTATVRTPFLRIASATIGAAPVPVPPPMPAAMKTRLAPAMAERISSRDSSAAARPTSGRPPAPRPPVN